MGRHRTRRCQFPPLSLPTHRTCRSYPTSDFCLAASGYRLQDPRFDTVYGSGYATPTLHLIGKADNFVSSELTQSLVDISTNKRVEYHDGG